MAVKCAPRPSGCCLGPGPHRALPVDTSLPSPQRRGHQCPTCGSRTVVRLERFPAIAPAFRVRHDRCSTCAHEFAVLSTKPPIVPP